MILMLCLGAVVWSSAEFYMWADFCEGTAYKRMTVYQRQVCIRIGGPSRDWYQQVLRLLTDAVFTIPSVLSNIVPPEWLSVAMVAILNGYMYLTGSIVWWMLFREENAPFPLRLLSTSIPHIMGKKPNKGNLIVPPMPA